VRIIDTHNRLRDAAFSLLVTKKSEISFFPPTRNPYRIVIHADLIGEMRKNGRDDVSDELPSLINIREAR